MSLDRSSLLTWSNSFLRFIKLALRSGKNSTGLSSYMTGPLFFRNRCAAMCRILSRSWHLSRRINTCLGLWSAGGRCIRARGHLTDLGIWRKINHTVISLQHWSCVVFGELIVYLHFLCVLHLQYSNR